MTHPMPANLPEGFDPKQIIYRELDVPRLRYSHIDCPTILESGMRIERFVRRIALRGYLRNSPDWQERNGHELDLPVYHDSWIVIQLSRQTSVNFGTPAVKLNTLSPQDNDYGHLRYVDQRGEIDDEGGFECRLIYFAARFHDGSSEAPHAQGFTYYSDRGRLFGQEIDPDIRHPGNGGQSAETGGG